MPRTVVLLLLPLVACSRSRPSVDEVFADDPGPTSAQSASKRADASPEDAEAQVAAARMLFLRADRELRLRLIADLDRTPTNNLDDLLKRQDDMPDELRGRIVALAQSGADYAHRAIVLDRNRADARFFYAANLGLEAWGKGAGTAILEGLATRVVAAMDASVKADESFGEGAPLRARAAFYIRAPWPIGSRAKALAAVDRSLEIADTVLTHLNAADVYWKLGKKERAIAAWKRAVDAPADSVSQATASSREFARRALALAEA